MTTLLRANWIIGGVFAGGLMVSSAIPSRASAQQSCTTDADCTSPSYCSYGTCVTAGDGAAPSAPAAAVTSEAQVESTPAPAYEPLQAAAPPVAPAPAPQPIVATAPAPAHGKFFEHAYFVVGAAVSFSGTGGYVISPNDDDGGDTSSGDDDIEGDLSLETHHGTHLGAYLVTSRSFHVGLFVSAIEGQYINEPDDGPKAVEKSELLNMGVAMKAGGSAGPVWLGFGLDLGLASLTPEDSPVRRGLWLNPRFQVDVMATRDTALKAAVWVGAGPAVLVTVGDQDPEGDYTTFSWAVSPALQVGGAFGG